MQRLAPLIIVGCALVAGWLPARAAPTPSDWPSLNYDAAQSNYNTLEKTISAKNVLKLKVKWAARTVDASYPIVAAGKVYLPAMEGKTIHVHVLDVATGKQTGRLTKDAHGGLLYDGTTLYVAGAHLQAIDPSAGTVLAKIDATGRFPGSVFVNPMADKQVVLAGFANRLNTSIYTVDPTSNKILHSLPSSSANGAVAGNKIVTSTLNGSVFYDESTGKAVVRQSLFGSDWFAGGPLAYVVASVNRKPVTLYAYDGTGHRAWSRTVGPVLATQNIDWPHAVGPNALYIHTLRPQEGIQALDPLSGKVLWTQQLTNVNQLVLANNVLLALTYGLGLPVRLVAMHPSTGKIIGAIVLSPGYFAFYAQNGLMVANGMVFIRAEGPGGATLVALGLPGS